MKTDLQLVIDELQKEVTLLKKKINSCVSAMFFEEAEWYKQSLSRANQQLRKLQNLHNPNFNEIERINWSIEGVKAKRDKYKDIPSRSKHYISELKQLEERKSKLEQQLGNRFRLDSEVIADYLEKIISDELRQFKIIFEKRRLVVQLEKEGTALKVQLKRTEDYLYLDALDKSILKNMGFQLQDDHPAKSIPNFNEVHILPTLEMLARITFEVFRCYGNEDAFLTVSDS
ncbi:MAG: hypothetical protein AAF573_01295 [Bacteroidota bacterium]